MQSLETFLNLKRREERKVRTFFRTLLCVKEKEKKNIARFMHQTGFKPCLVNCPSDTKINNVERFSIERLETKIEVITAANQNKGKYHKESMRIQSMYA